MQENTSPLHVIILAAGEGTRMGSEQPKVLADVGGKPMLQHVIDTVQGLRPQAIHLVYGFGGDAVRAAFSKADVQWVHQEQRRGTGDAVAQALADIPNAARALVVYGDVPLASGEDLRGLLKTDAEGIGVLTMKLQHPRSYGRILRDDNGAIAAIVEAGDAEEAQLRIREVNSGFMVAPVGVLKKLLARVTKANVQEEIYLTDVVSLAVARDIPVTGVHSRHPNRLTGANDRIELARLERYYQTIRINQLMLMGAGVRDPKRLDIRGNVVVGRDVLLDIDVILEGNVSLGDGVQIGPYCHLKNTNVAAGTRIESHSVVDGAEIGAGCVVGPFARLRPGTVLADKAKVGNFVEAKKANIGKASKVNHLSYIGDAKIGARVNVGAGTITCNYDGAKKHQTVIDDGAFIGSGTQLVAPVKVGRNATIGAGSTITKDTADDSLALSRAEQTSVENWQRPGQKKTGKGD